jgi:hypothetical protein
MMKEGGESKSEMEIAGERRRRKEKKVRERWR